MKKLFLLVCMAALFFSCQKEEPKPSDPTSKDDYLSLKIGNYWVYQCYRVDPLGNEEFLNRTDSVIVKCDTTIRNNKYYVLENFMGITPCFTFLRDSSGYIVNETGGILFSATNFTDILSEGDIYDNGNLLYKFSSKMEKIEKQVTIPAGSFNDVLNCKHTFVIPQSDDSSITKVGNNFYANNVGKIFYEEHFLGSDFWLEKRLIRYRVQ